MRKLKKNAAALFAGALCAVSAAAGVVGALPSSPVMAQTEAVESKELNNPTQLQFNKQYKLNINGKKDGSFYYFKTDSSGKPYKFEFINDGSSYDWIRVYCYKYGSDSDSREYLIDDVGIGKNKDFTKTFDSFEPNCKYMLNIQGHDTYTYQYYNNPDKDFFVHLKITHEGAATPVTTYNNIVRNYNGTWTYFKNNNPDYTFTGLAKTTGGAWIHVTRGVWDTSYTGLSRAASGKWYYAKKGRWDKYFTGLAKAPSGKWYHVTKGVYDKTYTGLSKAASGKWYYVRNGKYDTSYTGLTTAPSGKLYYVKNGKYDTSFTGSAPYNGRVYKVTNGRV